MRILASNQSPILFIEGLSKLIGTQSILADVSLSVRRGTVTALIGPSGAGKSTLLRCINALEDYQAGEIRLAGKQLSYAGEGSARRRLPDRLLAGERSRIGMVFQSYTLFPHLSVEDNITLGLRHVKKLSRTKASELADHWLARVGLPGFQHRYPHQLSGGQLQRIAIARALALEPELLLLDEVTSALDPELTGEVLAVIRDLASVGTTMLVVSHEMAFIREVADEVVLMRDGRIVAVETPHALFEPSSAAAAFVSRLTWSARSTA